MKTITWLKVKLAAGLGAAALLAVGAATVAIAQTGRGAELTAQEITGRSRAAYATLSSYRDSGTVVSEMAGQKNTLSFSTRLQRPNRYRIDWTQETGLKGVLLPPNNGVVWSDGSGDYFQSTAAGQEQYAKPQKMQTMKEAFRQAAGGSWSAASTIPGTFFNQDFADVFVAPALSGRRPLAREKDAKIGDVDCYVVSSVVDSSKQPDRRKSGTSSTMLWIGKRDFLIHQTRTTHVEKVDASAPPSDQAIDEAIKKSLEMQHKPATPETIAAMRPQMRAIMKQVQSTLKSGFESGIAFTQTHNNIVVNHSCPV